MCDWSIEVGHASQWKRKRKYLVMFQDLSIRYKPFYLKWLCGSIHCNFFSTFKWTQIRTFLQKAREAYADHLTTTHALEQYHIHWVSESYRLHFVTLPLLDSCKNIYNICHSILKVLAWRPRGIKLESQVDNWRNLKDKLLSHVVQALNERDFMHMESWREIYSFRNRLVFQGTKKRRVSIL